MIVVRDGASEILSSFQFSDLSSNTCFAAIAALLRHLGSSRVKIGVGGALVQFHPTYMGMLKGKLELVAPLTCHVSTVGGYH